MLYNERTILDKLLSIKAAITDEDEIMTKTATVHVTLSGVTAKWQDNEKTQALPADFTAEMIMDALVSVTTNVLAGETPEEIDVQNGVAGLVALDESSMSVAPVLLADDADAHFIEALTMNGIGGQLTRKNGHELTTGMPVIQILRLKNNDADVYAKTAMYRPLTAYLRSMLTGQNIVTVEEATLTGMFDQLTGAWDTQALALTDLTKIQLPEVGEIAVHDLTNHDLVVKISHVPSVKVR